MASPSVAQLGEALQQINDARFELSRFDFAAAARKASEGLTREDISDVQRERLLLLRADAYHGQQDFERALRDATQADQLAAGQSPQAQFIRGRELFSLCRVNEAKDAFDMADVLMQTPTPLRYTSVDGQPPSVPTAWANVGICASELPQDSSEGPPVQSQASERTVSFEWAADLVRWRAIRDECHAALNVAQTRLVPRAVLGVTQSLMERRLAQKSSRYVVLLIRNDTTEPLVFDFHKFKDGQFLEGCALPHVIPPLSIAIAGAHANGWLSGVKGSIAFKLHTHTVLFTFDCPLTSGFSSKACIVPRSQVLANGALSPTAKAGPVATILDARFRASASNPSYIQGFSVTMQNSVRMTTADIAAILDFLPAAALRKTTAVSKAWRQLCMRAPPSRFYGLGNPFPDYRLESDFEENCWSVRDSGGVKWSVRSDPTFNDERNISFLDSSEQRVFFLTCDVFARATNAVLYYGTKKSPLIGFEESFFRASRKTTVKMASRTILVLTCESNTVELRSESSTGPVVLTLDRTVDTLYSVRDRHKREIAKVIINSRTARKASNVAELIMYSKADALLCSVITFFALFRAT